MDINLVMQHLETLMPHADLIIRVTEKICVICRVWTF